MRMAPCSNSELSGAGPRSGRRHNELREAAVAVLANHGARGAKLLVAAPAPGAVAASRQVVQANSVAGLEGRHRGTGSFDDTGHFVAEREWQRASRLAMCRPGTGVGVACPRRLDAHQHVPKANLRHRNRLVLEVGPPARPIAPFSSYFIAHPAFRASEGFLEKNQAGQRGFFCLGTDQGATEAFVRQKGRR